MAITFYKYHGAGNDFIIIDDRNGGFSNLAKETEKVIYHLCRRHYGIGANGLMLMQSQKGFDFYMKYYNSDGREGSMCGNGGRCMVAFAENLGIIKEKTIFNAIDGAHQAAIQHKGINNWEISLKMKDVETIKEQGGEYVLNTGSPHMVIFSEDIANKDIYEEGVAIRYSPQFAKKGINVNFAEVLDKSTIRMRTYERGVEHETLACGTGATAVAIAAWAAGFRNPENSYKIIAPGGELQVSFAQSSDLKNGFRNVWLQGPVEKVFEGTIEI
jgi:diaminopimelate epimerase